MAGMREARALAAINPLRTTTDAWDAHVASQQAYAAEERRLTAMRASAHETAAEEARLAAMHATQAADAYRYPAVGSRIVVESQRAYLGPQVWHGRVVRHARSQSAIAVELDNRTTRLVSTETGEHRIIEVTAPPPGRHQRR